MEEAEKVRNKGGERVKKSEGPWETPSGGEAPGP